MSLLVGEDLLNMNGPKMFPRFAGTFRYEGEINLEISMREFDKVILELPKASDCAEIFINKEYGGIMIGSPYSIEVTTLLKQGKNNIDIEITNTLVWERHDGQSTHMQLYPTGMLKNPILKFCKKVEN